MQALEDFSSWFSLSLLWICCLPRKRSKEDKGKHRASQHERRGRQKGKRPKRKPSLSNFVLVSDSPEDLRGFLMRLFLGDDPVPREVIHLIPWGPVFDKFAREFRLSPRQFSSRLGVSERKFSAAVRTYVEDDDPAPLGDILSAPIARLRQSEIFEKMISACWNQILEAAERRQAVVGDAETDEASLALASDSPSNADDDDDDNNNDDDGQRGRRRRRTRRRKDLHGAEAIEMAELARAKSEERKAKKKEAREAKTRLKEEKRLLHDSRRRAREAERAGREESRWERTVNEMHAARTREEEQQRLKKQRDEELQERSRRHARHRAEEQTMGWNEGFRDRGRRFGLPFAEAVLPEERVGMG